MVGDSLAKSGTFEQQPRGDEGGGIWREGLPGRGNSQCKGPEVGAARRRPVWLEHREGGREGGRPREEVRQGGDGGRHEGPEGCWLFLCERWEPWRVLSRGGSWSDLGFHRIPLAASG